MASTSKNSDLAAKFKGCLVGSLIGDCLGGFFEGQSSISNKVLESFFSDLLEESKPILPYTDDTAMTISVAQSLIENEKICVDDLAKKFTNEFFENAHRRYGMNAAKIFVQLRDSEFEDVFYPAKMSFNGSGSSGNGAAMRISPIALFAYDKDEDFIKEAVKQCSFITHTHPDGYNGAILQCLAVHSALKLDPSIKLDPLKFISELEDQMKKIEMKDNIQQIACKKEDTTLFNKLKELFIGASTSELVHEEGSSYCDSLRKIKNLFLENKVDMSTEEVAKYLGNNVLALKSVPIAIYSFLKSLNPLPDYENSSPFVRTIYFAISVGGDTDTIASMAGSIAGAYYGINEIPLNLQHRCEKKDCIEKLADDLLQVTLCEKPLC